MITTAKQRPHRKRSRLTAALVSVGLIVTGALAGGAGASAAAPSQWMYAGDFQHVYTPPSNKYLNDHSVIRDTNGTWHLFSIQGATPSQPGVAPDSNAETKFLHATASSLNGSWSTGTDALSVDPAYGTTGRAPGSGETHLWAPHVIRACTSVFSSAPKPCNGGFGETGKYYMFYAGGGTNPANAAINLATTTNLNGTWTRDPGGSLFRDGWEARDPFVTWANGKWYMYYTATKYQSGGLNTVEARTSTDLVNWSTTSEEVFKDVTAENGSAVEPLTESPVVINRNGVWYLLIGPRGGGYTGTDVYWSNTPDKFVLENYAGHIDAHAPEIITDTAGKDWVTNAGWFQAGLDLAPVEWSTAPRPWQGTAPVAVGKNLDGRLEVFGIGPDGATLDNRFQKADGTWSAWNEGQTGAFGPGGAATVPSVARNKDGRLEVFALDRGNNSIAHRWQTAANSGWGPWEGGFGPTAAGGSPAVASNLDGRLEVVAMAPGGASVSHIWQKPDMSWNTNWELLRDTPVGAPPVMARDATGKLHIIAVTPGFQTIEEKTQLAPNSGWGPWQVFGENPAGSAPAMVASENNGIIVLAVVKPYGAGVAYNINAGGNWLGWNGGDTVFTGTVNVVPEGNDVRIYATGPSRVPGSVHNFTRTLLIGANGAPVGGWTTVTGGENSGCAPGGGMGVAGSRWAISSDEASVPMASLNGSTFGSWQSSTNGGTPCGQPTRP